MPLSFMGTEFYLSDTPLKAAILVSLLSAWVLVGLFQYLNRYTQRRYFSIWTAAWLFYALFLTISIFSSDGNHQLLIMSKNCCIVTAAVLLLWGSFAFLDLRVSDRLIGMTLCFAAAWSYAGSFEFSGDIWIQIPAFLFLASASWFAGYSFSLFRKRKLFLGAGMLAFGFAGWGCFLGAYPFLQMDEAFASMTFLISGVLQVFIAFSMVVLVLEEVRASMDEAERQLLQQKAETNTFRRNAQASYEQYRNLFENARDAILVVSADLNILDINRAGKSLLRAEDGETLRDLQAHCALNQQHHQLSSAEWLTTLCNEVECTLFRTDGSSVRVQVRGGPITFEEQTAFQFCFVEMTEQARLQQQLRQAEKLSALGQMVSGIAHELNNPLAAIKVSTDLALLKPHLDPKLRETLSKVARESNRASQLVKKFLSFVRLDCNQLEAAELNKMVESALEACRPGFASNQIRVETHNLTSQATILASPVELQQVLINLLVNAQQALSSHPGERLISVSIRTLNESVEVRIEDSGPGIPDDVLPKIYEPFFTTKPIGSGTGLGLSICYSIVLNHQGKLHYERSPRGGACFVIQLPLHSVESGITPDYSVEADKLPTATGSEQLKILVLDDEPTLVEMLKEFLLLLGHEPTVFNEPQAALEALGQGGYDLVFSDFRMPGMSGGELYRKAISTSPELASSFVFFTGDVVNTETSQFFKSTGLRYILKPFELREIEATLAELQAEKQPSMAA